MSNKRKILARYMPQEGAWDDPRVLRRVIYMLHQQLSQKTREHAQALDEISGMHEDQAGADI